ncbi:TetR/AcrR family transcriptional regulator [Pseudonocardia sp. DSM 110487]|uniref:TetR/AcrR family transcriptional regulator n=1 Tax=Pseudonocardia sp. DSM 110487 TaxID=2865833 RepID=UPI001C69C447|nr:TetR/AcrR family transcriptional regulator [Pseudonocardia sp. DSM 110487]QYN39518.1 TetR/AcrR family transcriptional regulator [Pseudonocardia sp. DSM 110487]
MSPRGVPVDPVERADRILDAAARLLLRYGHDRTTINDIAREAGIAKGSVYAHWRSRDRLFLALLRRERAVVLTQLRDRLRAAERPADLELLLVESVRAYQRSPLVTAVLTRDTEVLGGLARAAAEEGRPTGGITELVVTLREAGLVRTDRTLAEQVTVLSAMFLGYFLTAPLMPEEFRVPDDVVPGLVAEAVWRSLQRPEPLTPGEVTAMDRAVRDHVDRALAVADEQLQAALTTEETA